MCKENKTVQEVVAPIRGELIASEINVVKKSIMNIFQQNNLSIRQAKGILMVINDSLEDCRPWNYSTIEKSKNV